MSIRIVFLAASVKHYRLPFYDLLHATLQQDGIDLRVLYGNPNSTHAARKDNVDLPPTYGRRVPSYWFADRVVYQAAWREIADADLVITPNENKLLLNPMLLALRAAGAKRVAFWGKGDITPATWARPSEWLRYVTAGAVDWWFPYTEGTADNLRRHGVRCGITAIANSIDTSRLHRELASLTDDCLRHGRYSLGLGRGPVAVFCGNLSPNKHLDFLFAAGRIIREAIPNFSLVVMGNGPQREYVELTATRDRFIRYLGPRIGREKALVLRLADVFLLPGAVGLAVLDSFAAGLPLLTTNIATHGPEFGYLSHSVNGWITPHDVSAYALATIELLADPVRMAQLRKGAQESSYRYTIEGMVENFRRGILSCLESDQLRSGNVPPYQTPIRSSETINDFRGGQS